MTWYEKAFCQNYLDVYAHRTDDQARAEVEFAKKHLQLKTNQIVLDLCCGAGRHAFALSPMVKTVVGYDLSSDLLGAAAKENLSRNCANIYWQKGDMRHFDFKESFDAVVNFFNSFGYFENEEENLQVLKNIFCALKPKGRVLMDLMNKTCIIKNLQPISEKIVNEFLVKETRSISPDGLRVKKQVKIFQADQLINEYQESVRMYTPKELTTLLSSVGFSNIQFFGSLTSEPVNDTSSRIILVAEKN